MPNLEEQAWLTAHKHTLRLLFPATAESESNYIKTS